MGDRRLELYVETLTGTAFELQVSPLETIMSIKAKIQHLEGIPISQQHLIWKTEELDNACCLEDYSIADGATLKLVLGMRGGPLNTRMYTGDRRPSLSTMADYLENAGDELSESRPLTVVVFHDGEQVHWYTVIDEADSYRSNSHSRCESTTTASSIADISESVMELSSEQINENQTMRRKMSALQKRFQSLGLKKKSKKRKSPPTPLLPPLHPQGQALITEKHHRRVTRGLRTCKEGMDTLPSIGSANVLDTGATCLPLPSCCSTCSNDPPSFPTPTAFSPLYGRTRVLPDIAPSSQMWQPHDVAYFSSQTGTPLSGQPQLETWLRNRPKTTPDKWGLYRPFDGLPLSSSQKEPFVGKSVRNVGVRRVPGFSKVSSPTSRSIAGIGSIVAAGLRGFGSSRSRKKKNPKQPTSDASTAASGEGQRPASNTLPPIQVKKGKRCGWCNKKTGLASSYICRCGRNFCATHRYPETHRCSYDFKAEGRKILEKSNPLVTAPKLPKI